MDLDQPPRGMLDIRAVPSAPAPWQPDLTARYSISELCRMCKSMLHTFRRDHTTTYSSYHGSFSELRRSVNQTHCALCYQFYRSSTFWFSTSNRELPEQPYEWISQSLTVNVKASFVEGFTLIWKLDSTGGRSRMDLIVDMLPTENIRHFPASSSDSLGLAAWWLQNCRTTHQECQLTPKKDYLPTRLLALNESRLRICLGSSIPANTAYATLSHCWGEQKYLCLTRDTLAPFCSNIPEEALSCTVRDAVKIARSLGFCYIWIDTLCIVQDDSQDWSHESSLMSAVYGGSELNIAATSARNGSEGCFFDRPMFFQCDVGFDVNGKLHRHKIVPGDYDIELDEAPLLRRGWVLQERLLSRRMLHFTRSELVWECYHTHANETFPCNVPAELLDGDSLQKRPLDRSMWGWITSNYSECQLTRETDKLVAISGLARQIHSQSADADQYCAGMWRNGLEYQLMWMSNGFQKPRARPQEYIAPTWSWASYPEIIAYSEGSRSRTSVLRATVLDVEIQHTTDDYFGSIRSAKLHMGCQFPPLKVSDAAHDMIELSNSNAFDYDTATDIDSEDYTVVTEETESRDQFMLLIADTQSWKYGILLEPTAAEKGVYTRVGYFESTKENFTKLFDPRPPLLVDEQDCLEVRVDEHGRPVYVIEIM